MSKKTILYPVVGRCEVDSNLMESLRFFLAIIKFCNLYMVMSHEKVNTLKYPKPKLMFLGHIRYVKCLKEPCIKESRY